MAIRGLGMGFDSRREHLLYKEFGTSTPASEVSPLSMLVSGQRDGRSFLWGLAAVCGRFRGVGLCWLHLQPRRYLAFRGVPSLGNGL